jgi:alpha-1,3-rhamnosyl/mannosyltransferase
MRLLLDCRMASWTGVGRYTRGLEHALSSRDDIQLVRVIAPDAPASLGGAQSVTATRHPFSPAGALELGSIVRRVAPDLTHCLHFPTPMPARSPLVVTLHDLSPLVVAGLMPSALKRHVYRVWNRRAVRRADHIIADSASTARDLARFFPHAAGKTSVVLLAADDFAAGSLGELPEWLQGQRYILSMGNTRPHKDLPTLLRAFASLADDRLQLVLAGNDVPGYAASIIGAAAERVRFTGPVDDPVLRRLYRDAEVFAFPSLYEGFGLPPLEAMSFGVPVITTSAASLPEVVGDAALLFPPRDADALTAALARLLSDDALRQRLSEAGRRQAAIMSWERTAAETIAVYERVLGEVRA